ncbi:MAG TPA: hypothetical protein VGA04_33895 [Streptosporangiaceae bacterium]
MMTEPPTDPSATPDPQPHPDPVELLVRAVGQLDPADRDRVLAWLLRRDAGWTAAAWAAPAAPEATARRRPMWLTPDSQSVRALAQADITLSLRASSPPAAQQMVPVRFSTDQHAQLREWCAEHGFSMATVIRGLVARFLEGQLPGRA